MIAYLEKRLATELHMAEVADSVCARNSHLHLAELYRLRIARIRAVHAGKPPARRVPGITGRDIGTLRASPADIGDRHI